MGAHAESEIIELEQVGQPVVQEADEISLEPIPTRSRQQEIVNAVDLKRLCKDCLLYFTELASSLTDATLQDAIDIGYDRESSILLVNEERTRFEVWTLSVWEPPSLIPDKEGEKLPSTHDVARRAKRILRDLYGSLHKASLIVSGLEKNEIWPADDVGDSDGSSIDSCESVNAQRTSELEELLTSITESNSRLVRLSLVLRKAVRPDDHAKASSRRKLDPALDIEFVRSKFRRAQQKSDWLLERLGRAITKRREYLKYCEETNSTGFEAQPSDSHASSTSQTIESPEQIIYDTFNGLPKLHAELRTPFQCPFCRQKIVISGWTEWKTHTYADLKAYVCTFKECDMRLFSDTDEWFGHELKTHRREWVCSLCQTCESAKTAFESHLQSTHGLTNIAQIEAFVLQSEEPVDKFSPNSCLLCDEWSQDRSTDRESGGRWGSVGDFQSHLGGHLESLALQALVKNGNGKGKDPEHLQTSLDMRSWNNASRFTDTDAKVLGPVELPIPVPVKTKSLIPDITTDDTEICPLPLSPIPVVFASAKLREQGSGTKRSLNPETFYSPQASSRSSRPQSMYQMPSSHVVEGTVCHDDPRRESSGDSSFQLRMSNSQALAAARKKNAQERARESHSQDLRDSIGEMFRPNATQKASPSESTYIRANDLRLDMLSPLPQLRSSKASEPQTNRRLRPQSLHGPPLSASAYTNIRPITDLQISIRTHRALSEQDGSGQLTVPVPPPASTRSRIMQPNPYRLASSSLLQTREADIVGPDSIVSNYLDPYISRGEHVGALRHHFMESTPMDRFTDGMRGRRQQENRASSRSSSSSYTSSSRHRSSIFDDSDDGRSYRTRSTVTSYSSEYGSDNRESRTSWSSSNEVYDPQRATWGSQKKHEILTEVDESSKQSHDLDDEDKGIEHSWLGNKRSTPKRNTPEDHTLNKHTPERNEPYPTAAE